MNKEFTLETKDELKREIDHQFIRLATELKEEIDDNFNKANEKLINQQVLINTLKDRIDKAIEYINQHSWGLEKETYRKINELEDILKGSDSNEIN